MTHYIKFPTADGGSVLVETDAGELPPLAPGKPIDKIGLREAAARALTETQTAFQDSLKAILLLNVEIFLDVVNSLPRVPDEMEINFGVKVTGEVGNFAISKFGGEGNYSVKLAWKSGGRNDHGPEGGNSQDTRPVG